MNFFVRIFFMSACFSLWVIPGEVNAQRKSSNASKVSQSQSPENLHNKSYEAPSSNSLRAGKRTAKIINHKSDKLVLLVMNEPRGPIRPSDRARYYGIGSLELGINTGFTHGFTDLTGKPGQGNVDMKNILVDNAAYYFGAYARYNINSWFGVSGGLSYGHLSGHNPNGFDYAYDFAPDELGDLQPVTTSVYSFENNIYELSGRLELHGPLSKNGGLGVYGFAGFAAFYQKPLIFDEIAQEINIPRPVNMKPESPISFALPVGVGFRMMAAKFIRLGLEVGYRYTANQGLDGVYVLDTRYDSYMYSGITVGYVLPAKK